MSIKTGMPLAGIQIAYPACKRLLKTNFNDSQAVERAIIAMARALRDPNKMDRSQDLISHYKLYKKNIKNLTPILGQYPQYRGLASQIRQTQRQIKQMLSQ